MSSRMTYTEYRQREREEKMAQYAHNKAVQNLIDRGMTPGQITEECPALDLSVWSNGEIDACTWNRGDQAKFLAYYEGKIEALDRQAEEKAAGKEEQPLATPRQIAFIQKLIGEGRHLEGGFYAGPTTMEGLVKLSKTDASVYIDSLLGKY